MGFRRCYSTTRSTVLDLALRKVPELGFENALTAGVREAGYTDTTTAMFFNGVYDLVHHHLQKERNALISYKDKNLGQLVISRLKGNVAIEPRLTEALAIMTTPSNITSSLKELHKLSDEILYLSNDRSHDFDWYTKRAGLSSLYVSSELFMLQDRSIDYRDTWEFVENRLHEVQNANYAVSSVSEWLKFNTIAGYNVLRSLTR